MSEPDTSDSILTKYYLDSLFESTATCPLISLHDQEFTEIEHAAFESFTELRTIEIRKCKLKSLVKENFMNRLNDDTAVYDFLTINFIDLSYNSLTRIDSDTFLYTKKLTELNLSGNSIEKLSSRAFQDLKSLSKLSLNNNRLTSVDSELFKSLTRLKQVDLSSNRIRGIPEFAFNDLLNLAELDLSNNCIKEVHVNSFVNLPNLAKLTLKHNCIERIKERTLKQLNSSRLANTVVNLSFNNVRFLNASLFDKLTSGSTVIYQVTNNRSILDFRAVYNDIFQSRDDDRSQLKLKKSIECSSMFVLLIQSNTNVKSVTERLERQRVFDILIQNKNVSSYFLMNVIELYLLDTELYQATVVDDDFKLENESFKILCKHGNEDLLRFFLKRNDFTARGEYNFADFVSIALLNNYESIALCLVANFQVSASRSGRFECQRMLKTFFESKYNEARYRLDEFVNDRDGPHLDWSSSNRYFNKTNLLINHFFICYPSDSARS
jgi:hypothetical protein